MDIFIETCRHYVAAYMAVFGNGGGADAICFTGGIGQNGAAIRAGILENMAYAGIALDAAKNNAARGNVEARLDAVESRVQIWMLPTNEELIVAHDERRLPCSREPNHEVTKTRRLTKNWILERVLQWHSRLWE